MSFVDALNDYYYLSQIINIPTRGSNIFKGRHIGLAIYLKSLTSELNEYISSGSCEQVKLLDLGLKSTLLKNVEQYSIAH